MSGWADIQKEWEQNNEDESKLDVVVFSCFTEIIYPPSALPTELGTSSFISVDTSQHDYQNLSANPKDKLSL